MKAELLSVLRDADDYVSGQDLCEKFGVSRTAVWKGINQLKEAGYEIEAVPNKGYKLLSVPDTLSEEELKSIFSDAFKTKKMVVTEQESTIGNYENYTDLDAIIKYTAGIMGVILYKVGETPEERMDILEKENAELKETVKNLKESNETLVGCVLEISEVVYQ